MGEECIENDSCTFVECDREGALYSVLQDLGIFQRPLSAHGVRNQQDSTFSLTGPPTFSNHNVIPKIINKYSQKRNCAAWGPISTFMCLWAIYIFPLLVCLFCCRKICGPILGIYKSQTQTHECRNGDWGREIPFLWEYINGIFVAVHTLFFIFHKWGNVLKILN